MTENGSGKGAGGGGSGWLPLCPLSSVEVTVTIRRGLTARDTWAGKMSLIDLKRCNSIESICEKREREREREKETHRHTDTQTDTEASRVESVPHRSPP